MSRRLTRDRLLDRAVERGYEVTVWPGYVDVVPPDGDRARAVRFWHGGVAIGILETIHAARHPGAGTDEPVELKTREAAERLGLLERGE